MSHLRRSFSSNWRYIRVFWIRLIQVEASKTWCVRFFLEFCTRMYMVGQNRIKYIDNEQIKSMYMMVQHVHDMYMSWHALIVNPSCTCYVYVKPTCTWNQDIVLQIVAPRFTPPCTCLWKNQEYNYKAEILWWIDVISFERWRANSTTCFSVSYKLIELTLDQRETWCVRFFF